MHNCTRVHGPPAESRKTGENSKGRAAFTLPLPRESGELISERLWNECRQHPGDKSTLAPDAEVVSSEKVQSSETPTKSEPAPVMWNGKT